MSDRDYDERAQKFWSIYVTEAEQYDTNITETWKANMDSTLIFVSTICLHLVSNVKLVSELQAGLFSATVTAFIIDSYKLLETDSGVGTEELLTQILALQIVAASLNTSAVQLPTTLPTTTSEPSASAILINVLWFLSLTCSLAAALCVTLVQQWIRDYLQRIQQTNQPQKRATIRGILFAGSVKWKMNDVVEVIPTLLHLSLFLFFAGLCTFLWKISMATALAVIAVVFCFLTFYGVATIAPLLDPTTPYETPFSSLLWHILQRRSSVEIGSVKPDPKSLSEAREGLASPPFDVPLHNKTQAVAWVYDRTTDDREMQELVHSIPGLLSTHDGCIAWRVFLSKGPGMAQVLESRIGHLLKSCSAAGHLDRKARQLRATLCVDALLAISSIPEFFNGSSNNIELDEIIGGPWQDDGMLATKALLAEAVFGRRSLLSEIPLMQHRCSNGGFRDLSKSADQALRDIDDMRQVLEDVLQEPGLNLSDHKDDIATLLKVYFSVVESKTAILNLWLEETRQILPKTHHLPLLSWYYSLPPAGLRITYEGVLAPSGTFELKLHAHQVLAYLRLHEVYPPILNAGSLTAQSLSTTWFPLTEEVPLRRMFHSGTRTFRPFSRDKFSAGKFTSATANEKPIDPQSAIYQHICRELQPVSALLDVLDASPTTTVTVHVKMPPQKTGKYLSRRLMSLTTRVEGPFSSLASILEAIIEDKGSTAGLVELIATLKSYAPEVETFQSSIIDQRLESICLPLSSSSSTSSMSKGSEVLLVGALRDILIWEREAGGCPLSTGTIERLLNLLNDLTHELPVEMAERALGSIEAGNLRPAGDDDSELYSQPSAPLRDRALCVYNRIMAHRASGRPDRDWQSPPPSPIHLKVPKH
ncbi:hypothetical protein H0H92_003213 [Tricholoma furcatifolium]|nr:hypothetical protein H0H92_003213 [Tricholoma furcatifolium]